jgi:hypothetical protein
MFFLHEGVPSKEVQIEIASMVTADLRQETHRAT